MSSLKNLFETLFFASSRSTAHIFSLSSCCFSLALVSVYWACYFNFCFILLPLEPRYFRFATAMHVTTSIYQFLTTILISLAKWARCLVLIVYFVFQWLDTCLCRLVTRDLWAIWLGWFSAVCQASSSHSIICKIFIVSVFENQASCQVSFLLIYFCINFLLINLIFVSIFSMNFLLWPEVLLFLSCSPTKSWYPFSSNLNFLSV